MLIPRVAAIAAILSALAGCGDLQSLKVAAPPGAIQNRAITLSGQPANNVGIASNALPIGDGTYISQTSGGSLAVGLLFGGVGSLINSSNVAAESDRVRNAVNPASMARIQPAVQLAAAWQQSAHPAQAPTPPANVEPFIIFYLDDTREHVHVVPGLRVTGPELTRANGTSPWEGHYLFAIEKTIPRQRLNESVSDEELAEQSMAVQTAYRALLKEVTRDLQGGEAPKRMVAFIKAPALKATAMGFAGFTSGDIDQERNGRLAIRVNIENYGPAMSRTYPYFVWVFPSAAQYVIDNGPEPRRAAP